MNEGKPAKAKWWNRPRPQGPSGQADGVAPTPDESSGAGPAVSAAPEDAGERVRAGDTAHDTDGDFELARPAVGTVGDGASDGGDFELARPRASAATGGPVLPEGDFELARPAGAPEAPVLSAGDAAPVPASAVPAPSAPAAPVTAAPAPAASAPADPGDARPKPLHDPDPYSTPPYGEPGPWAPAPPVQHPATTPAHGTAVPAPPPPTHGAPAPAPVPGTPAPSMPQAAAPAPAPAPAAAPAQAQAPALATAEPAPVPTPTPIPALATAEPASVPTPTPTPAPGIPAQTGLSAPDAPARATPAPAYAEVPPPAYAEAPPPANPWQNYDPWSREARPGAPLQQNGAAVTTQEQRHKRGRKVLLVGAVLLALVSGGVGGAVGAYLERNGGVGDVELPQAGAEPAGRSPDSVAGIAARALPSVVTLHVSGSDEQGTGTGFVLDDRGHILTNNHVVEPAGDDGEISVTFHSGDTAKATVVGRDSGYDLAVVKVTGVSGLKPLPLGNSDNVQVGDPVVAIGAPFDLAGTVTSGIISAKERPITAGGESGDGSDVSYVDALQTDAPINPGNSGGPLLDARARVVGINSAIRSADSGSDLDGGQAGSIGLGFAIPVNQAKRVAEELINTGRATHPVIGVTLDMDYTGDGARVGTKGSGGGSAVADGGPGDKAGIKPGDVITEVDGQRVHSGEELIVKTRAHRPGDRLELTLERGGKEVRISLTLGSSSGN
ncbi:S1C family serine protease [Streptomyces caeruleatus]|uniref:Protease n=1 Tax=Streptomyces caeruleatus TaxID=661399 RepID=A0A124IA28_9ACTN|nr:trypsin-like peptidase domain-containing protein [Streptomyces caeruleatus]KUO04400.1 protease [Streptomyces caeruleatus]